MTDPELPPDLRAFLISCVDAVEQAEILVRLHASEGAFTARTLAPDLGLSDTAARHHLEQDDAEGIHVRAPRSAELQRFAELLVEWWGHSRSAVLRFIATHSRGPLQSFSNAFRIRRKE